MDALIWFINSDIQRLIGHYHGLIKYLVLKKQRFAESLVSMSELSIKSPYIYHRVVDLGNDPQGGKSLIMSYNFLVNDIVIINDWNGNLFLLALGIRDENTSNDENYLIFNECHPVLKIISKKLSITKIRTMTFEKLEKILKDDHNCVNSFYRKDLGNAFPSIEDFHYIFKK